MAYRLPVSDTSRLNFGVSALYADQPDFLPVTATDNTRSAYAAYLWDIAPKVNVGVEALLGERELGDGTDGSLTRFTFSTKYGF